VAGYGPIRATSFVLILAFSCGVGACSYSVGDSCQNSGQCGVGRVCQFSVSSISSSTVTGTCEPAHDLVKGASCLIGEECRDALKCLTGTCEPAGSEEKGDPCHGDDDCTGSLRCAVEDAHPLCIADGNSDWAERCSSHADCFQGLHCELNICLAGSPWAGVSCADPELGPARAYFEVPKTADARQNDFFRLPFPNDALNNNGRLDLSGFPLPPEPAGSLLEAYASELSRAGGWGTSGTVMFRFSGAAVITTNEVSWVDITPNAPSNGSDDGVVIQYRDDRTAYVCEHSLAVRRPQGKPLEPGHTYGVWLKNAQTPSGDLIQPSADFSAMLSDDSPAAAQLAHAYSAYAPLRDYLRNTSADRATLIAATVITVRDVRKDMASIAAAVEGLAPPATSSWVHCQAGATSPCPVSVTECPLNLASCQPSTVQPSCDSGGPNYEEYQALISLPIFQRGTPPYLDQSEGGDVQAEPVRYEDVCISLTVPSGAPTPDRGWPLVVFAHGTGGSFRSHVSEGVAGALAGAETRTGVLGIDQVQHGTRRGASDWPPDYLFYNLLNPLSANGNPLQGAADQISLARYAQAAAIETDQGVIHFDPTALVFWGHSQGATEGSLMLPFADEFSGAVLSGNGAGLIDGLLQKHLPEDVASDAAKALQDPLLGEIGEFHPLLSLLQHWEDPSDPVNYAVLDAARPASGHRAKSVFQVYGLRDNYAPGVTMANYALAGGFALVSADIGVGEPDRIGTLAPRSAPLVGNVPVSGAQPVTLGVREYAPPAGVDGHFVAFDTASANADVVHFVSTLVARQPPQIGK